MDIDEEIEDDFEEEEEGKHMERVEDDDRVDFSEFFVDESGVTRYFIIFLSLKKSSEVSLNLHSKLIFRFGIHEEGRSSSLLFIFFSYCLLQK